MFVHVSAKSQGTDICLYLIKDLVLMISISPCTVAQEWTAHLSNTLSFGGCRRDVGFDSDLAEVDVENVCMFELCVMRRVHGDDVNELLECPADEE